jgi:hypothetical protein
MAREPTAADALAARRPLPLAQLFRRALNTKTPLDRHQAAYYLCEAALKLLGCAAVVAYADCPDSYSRSARQTVDRPACPRRQ